MLLGRFKPEDFVTDEPYKGTFEDEATETAARWLMTFLQLRGQGWAPFPYSELNRFYFRQAERGEDFSFHQLTCKDDPVVLLDPEDEPLRPGTLVTVTDKFLLRVGSMVRTKSRIQHAATMVSPRVPTGTLVSAKD